MCSKSISRSHSGWESCDRGGRLWRRCTILKNRNGKSNNYAATNPALAERVEADIKAFLEKNPGVKREDIPTDLLTASGSGLDPHISPASAEIQIPRIAEASGLTEEEIEDIVSENTQGKVFGVFGEETVNVLKINIEIAQRMGIL